MAYGILGLVAFLAAASAVTGTAIPAATIHQQIQQTYNFQPHLLQESALDAKSALLDQFWKQAKSHREDYVPALREELADFRNPPFFLYDGSVLLLAMSDTSADRKIALAGMAHCDLLDVDPRAYFSQVHRMATLGEDTTAAAFHVLEDPKFQVTIPQHALTLGQNYVLVYLLLPSDQRYWEQPAIHRLEQEPDETAQRSLILLLWYAQTAAADQAIAAFAENSTKPPASHKYVQELLQNKNKRGAKGRTMALFSSEEALRKKRRDRLKSVSDEALIDLDVYTELLIAKRKGN
jgi:hypothetical protein